MATVEERLAALERQMTKVTDELGESYTLSKTGQQTDQILGDAIVCTAQSLTTGQKTQARNNIGAAPDGFGLGKSAYSLQQVNPANIDACTAAGWYYYYDSAYGSLAGLSFSGGIFVIPSFTDTLQYFFPRGANPNPGTYAVRKLSGGTWTEWDINNPPLELGVEYRTTERYLGKPVYVKAVDCGNAESNSTWTVAHGVSSIANMIMATAQTGPYTGIYKGVTSDSITIATTSTMLNISTYQTWTGSHDVIATIKYTKTTD